MFKIIEVDNILGLSAYTDLLKSFEILEPYYLPDYISIFSGGLNNLICFSLTLGEEKVMMPGYLKPIIIGEEQTEFLDFITPYGYSGPLCSVVTSPKTLDLFWSSVDAWYKDNNVVTEFIRFGLFQNETRYTGKIFPTMLNIRGEIICAELQWSAFDHKVRKNVNKARRENLICKVYFEEIEDVYLQEFYQIYIQTMIRTNAATSFMYPFDDFKIFINKNSKYAAICTVYYDDKAISSELLLVGDSTIYSFLGGTNEQYFDKRPNDLLKVEALNWARGNGKKFYVLGGGYGYEDGIFKYKRAFFPDNVVNYYTGRKIVDYKTYLLLLNKRNNLRKIGNLPELVENDFTFFPLYNKTN